MRLNHNTFESGQTDTHAAAALHQRRPTHAAHAQLLVDADVVEDKVMHAWMDQGWSSEHSTGKSTQGSSTQKAKRMNTHTRGMHQEHAPGGVEFQIAAMEVCADPAIQLLDL